MKDSQHASRPHPERPATDLDNRPDLRASVHSWRSLEGLLQRASKAKGRRDLGASVAEGWRLLERALAADVRPVGVLLSERADQHGTPDELRVLAKLRRAGVPCWVAPDEAVRTLTRGRSFGELLGLVPRRDLGLAELLTQAQHARSVLVGVQILDPGNIGALTRTAHAFGSVATVWVGGTDPTHPKALRTSMGSCFRVPWTHTQLPPTAVVAHLAAAGWRSVATVASGGDPLQARISGSCAVWMGGEAHGLSQGLVAACDEAVRIETAPGIDSLSVNAAAAIVLSRVVPVGVDL